MANVSRKPLLEPVSTPQLSVAPGPRELRAQAVQRLQVGLFGLALMLLLVGLASIIMAHARLSDAGNVADSGAHMAASGSLTDHPDPLADIGVVPAGDAASPTRGGASPHPGASH